MLRSANLEERSQKGQKETKRRVKICVTFINNEGHVDGHGMSEVSSRSLNWSVK